MITKQQDNTNMKHLRKFNESISVSSDVLSYLKGIEHSTLHEIISDLEKELQEDEPDTGKLNIYLDDICGIAEDERNLNIDDDKIDALCTEIYNIMDDIDDKKEDEEFRNSLPPEEGGPSYKEKYINEFITYLWETNNNKSYDMEGRQQDINDLIKKFKKGESFT